MKTWIKTVIAVSLAAGLVALGVLLGQSPLLVEVSPEAQTEPPAVDDPLAQRAMFLQPALSSARAAAADGNTSLADIAERVRPSVVSVASKHVPKESTSSLPGLPFNLPFGGRGGEQFELPFPGQPMPNQPRQGLGSGVIVSADGIVLTNNHVIEGASEITVIDVNDKRHTAKVVGADPPSDLAVLKLDNPDDSLPALPFGDSAEVRPGDVVLAVGNPFGVGQTVTMGIVSAKGRSAMGIVDYEDFIQTDAAINPGNSGGALVSMAGELIGINTAILSRTGAYAGIGFAVPSKMARPIMQSLLEHGKVTRGFLGVTIQNMDEELAEAMGLDSDEGVLVTNVNPGSPAARAGLERGDVIVKLGAKAMNDVTELRNTVASKAPGSKVTLEFERDGKTRHATVELGELASEVAGPAAAETGPSFGIRLAPLDAALRQRLGLGADVRGAVVSGVAPNSPAAHAGLQPGDVIMEVNKKPVSSPAEVASALSDKTKSAVLLVRRGEGQLFVPLKPPRGAK